MWRPYEKGELEAKAAAEARKNAPKPINFHPNPAPRVTSEEIARGYEEDGCGWCNDLLKIVQYVVCCCGCCTSYEAYHDNA